MDDPDCAARGTAHALQCSHTSTNVCAAFRRASRAVTQLYDLVLAPTGLKATQFIVLQAIAEHDEVAQWQLAQDLALAVETLSRRLAVLRSAGLVIQRIGHSRKGERLYRLTPAGWARVQQATPYWAAAEQRLRAVLGSQWDTVLESALQLPAAARRAERLKMAARPKAESTAAAT